MLEPLTPIRVEVQRQAVVIGGGVPALKLPWNWPRGACP